MKILKYTITLIFLCQTLHAQNAGKHELNSNNEKLIYFNSILDTLRKASNNPGLAVSIIYGNELVLMNGFGFRNLNEKLPVTTQTIFQLGSLAKAMTGFIAAQLVDKELIKWNDPVVNYIPEFKMIDDYHTRNATIKDLMTHHTGLAQHYYLMYGPKFERNEILNLLPHLGLDATLREKYLYNNFTFTIGGILEERVTGETWERLVQDRIFTPLQMKNSYNQYLDIPKENEVALSYSRDGVRIIPEIHSETAGDTYGPAGGLYANIEDITKWTRMLIHKGINNNNTLLSSKQFSYITDPLVVRYPSENRFYGIGWDITTSKEYHTISHNGVTAGQKARILFIPELGFGVTVLCNQFSDIPSALTAYAEDIFVYGKKVAFDEAVNYFKKQSSDEKNKEPLKEYTISGSDIAFSLTDYCGQYKHPAYGNITISLKKNNQLVFSYYDFIGVIEHVKLTEFIAHTNHPTGKDDFSINFHVDKKKVTSFKIKFPAAPEMVFEKVAIAKNK